MAIAAAHGKWVKAKELGKAVGIAAYDLSAAFDTLDPNRLSDKLTTLGVTGTANNWFLDYMTGRKQHVKWDGTISPPTEVKYGVPQGSILGPVLFLCLLADLPDIIRKADSAAESSGYADDVVV